MGHCAQGRAGPEGLGLNWGSSLLQPQGLEAQPAALQTAWLALPLRPLKTPLPSPATQGPAGKWNLCVLKTDGLSPDLEGYSHVVLWQ